MAVLPCFAQGPPGNCVADIPHTLVPYGANNGGAGIGARQTTESIRVHYTVPGTNGTYDAEIELYKHFAYVHPHDGNPYYIDFGPGETLNDYLNALCGGPLAFSLAPNAPVTTKPAPLVRPAAVSGPSPIQAAQGIVAFTLANGSDVVAWLTGSAINTAVLGSGTQPQSTSQYATGPTPAYLISADFNGDGFADLAVTNFGNLSDSNGGNLQIFLGKGDGSFTPGAKISLGSPGSLAAGDFNGDGKLDIVVANVDQNALYFLAGIGDGTFQAAQTIALPSQSGACGQNGQNGNCTAEPILAADWNGDGRLDLAIGTYQGGSVAILIGNGNGTFRAPVFYPLATGQASYLATADLTGDGKLDLVTALPDANLIALLPGNGDGTFQAAQLYPSAASGKFFGIHLATDGAVITTIDNISGDMVALALPFEAAGAQGYTLSQKASAVAAGDLNGDGFPDLIAADGSVSVLLRNPKAQFGQPVNTSLKSGSTAVDLAVGDFNGDSKADLAVAGSGQGSAGTLDILLGNGDGTFGKQSSTVIPGGPGGLFGSPPSGLVAGDFKGDGKLDVAAGYQGSSNPPASGGIAVLLGNGDGTLRAPVNYAPANGSALALIGGDFNGDGKLDLVAGMGGAVFDYSTPGTLVVLLAKGDGTFQTVTTQVGSPAGTPVALAAADLNHDGRLDLVASVWNATLSDTLVVLLGNGDGTFLQLTPFKTSASGNRIALADLDGDGNPDLIVSDCCGLSEGVYLLGKGDGTFQAAQYFSSGSSIFGFATTDWNKDGTAGLAVASQDNAVLAFESGLNPKLTGAPQITAMENAAGGAPNVAPNTWLEIDGTGLAASGDTRAWKAADFVNGVMPAQLDGVEVTVNGKPAYVYYISPTQIDVLTPPDALPSGSVQVVAINNGAISKAFSAESQTISPSFFVFGGTGYAAAIHATGALLGPSTLYPGYTTPAKPGETIALYGNGFGPTSQTIVRGSSMQGGTLSPLPTVTIGGVQANVTYAGLVSPGEFQINVTVPAGLSSGDQAVVATYNGASTQTGVSITVQQ